MFCPLFSSYIKAGLPPEASVLIHYELLLICFCLGIFFKQISMNVTQMKEDAAIAVIICQARIPVVALQGKVCIVTLTLTISA